MMRREIPRAALRRGFRLGVAAIVISVVLIFAAILVFFVFRAQIFGTP